MIIGISGEINSGKDTVGKMIQYLTCDDVVKKQYTWQDRLKIGTTANWSDWQIKKFADKLKEIVCLLIGCTREQLEDREFKEKELGEEWWYISKPEIGMLMPYTEDNWAAHGDFEENLVMLTPRKLLQLLGTECGREIIHPNIWVNVLFADYEPIGGKMIANPQPKHLIYPNWIITDVRFPNEAEAIKDRCGIVIRVNRIEKGKFYTVQDKNTKEIFKARADVDYRSYDDVILRCENNFVHRLPDYNVLHDNEHPSETALDDYEFDHVINNDGSLDELLDKVKQILENEQL